MKRLVLLLFVAITTMSCGSGIDYSDGDRVGVVTKFSHRGLFCKTWEGEMVLGGLRSSGDGLAANVWPFTVVDPTKIEDVKRALETGARTKITYHQVYFSGVCYSGSSYLVSNVEILG